MNKGAVCDRPGWTKARVEKFLVVEHCSIRRFYGKLITEYEYSTPQVEEAEKSEAWRKAAAKYLRVPLDELDLKIAAIRAEEKAERDARAAQQAELDERSKASSEELNRLAETVRGGFRRLGLGHPLSDGWRTFSVTEVVEYIDLADRRGRINADYIREFYRLWSDGAGYCNPKGVMRKLIAPVKERLIRILLIFAKRGKWEYGIGLDDKKNRVLYFDTPKGQVSFHLPPYVGAEYPEYPGRWSGVRDAEQILIALCASLKGRVEETVQPEDQK